MRSVKGIIIGFLLILLGFAAAQYSLVAAGILAAGGLAVVVVSALPKKIEKQPQEPPAAPAPVKPDLSSPEQLPDILTAPPVQPEPPAPPQPEAEALYKTLAEAYTRIEGLSCRGPAWMLERDIRLCKGLLRPLERARSRSRRRQHCCGKRYALLIIPMNFFCRVSADAGGFPATAPPAICWRI